MIIGLTGRIASGKNQVASELEKRGYISIDVDKVGHQFLENKDVQAKLIDSFGDDVVRDGEVNRIKLAKIAFSNKEQLAKLNAIMHPLMVEKVKEMISNSNGNTIVNAAVLFEMELDHICEKVIVVDTSDDEIIRRLMIDGVVVDQINCTMAMQMSREEYLQKADIVIENDSSEFELAQKVSQLDL